MLNYLGAFALLAPLAAAAQEPTCASRSEWETNLTGRGMSALFVGKGAEAGKYYLIEVWADPESRAWVQLMTTSAEGGMSCLVDGGSRYVDEHGGSLKE